MTRQSCSRSFERGFNPYCGRSWDRGDVASLVLLLMAPVNGTSCGNRYKACSASLPDHPVWVFLRVFWRETLSLLAGTAPGGVHQGLGDLSHPRISVVRIGGENFT
jgi:hypothetical protein